MYVESSNGYREKGCRKTPFLRLQTAPFGRCWYLYIDAVFFGSDPHEFSPKTCQWISKVNQTAAQDKRELLGWDV